MVAIILTEALFGASPCTDFNGVFGSNNLRCPCFSSGFSISETPTFEISLGKKRVKKQKRIVSSFVVSCGLDNGIIGKEELEFKPSFGEYLKAMESVKEKKERDSVRRKKSEEKGKFGKPKKEKFVESSDFVELNEKYEGVGVVKESVGGGKSEFRMVKNQKKQNISKDKHVDEIVSMEREAFKTMDGDVYNKPRVTKAEMEERIQKLAKW